MVKWNQAHSHIRIFCLFSIGKSHASGNASLNATTRGLVRACLLIGFWDVQLKSSVNIFNSISILPYFPWLCAWGRCTIICCQFHICIYPGTAAFRLFYYFSLKLLQSYCRIRVCASNRVHDGLMVVLVSLHISLSHCHHCLRWSQFSRLFFM